MASGLISFLVRLAGGKAASSGARTAAGNATRQVARRDAAKRLGRIRRKRFLRRAGKAALIGGLLSSLFGGGSGSSDQLDAAGGLGGLGGGAGAGGSGDFDITLPPEVAAKKAKKISNPTLVTISNQITDLTNIALAIAQVAKEEQQVLIASLKAKESGAQEAALESGAEMIPAAGSGEDISPLDDSVQGLIAAIDELRERIEQGGGGDGGGLGPAALGAGAAAGGGLGLLAEGALAAASLLPRANILSLAAAPMLLALTGIDEYAKAAEKESKQKHEQGIARYGLTGNNFDGYKINGRDAGKLSDLPYYYQKVVEGYGVLARDGAEGTIAARKYVQEHNPDGTPKGATERERELAAKERSIHNEADRIAKDLRAANDATRAPANSAASSAPPPQPTRTSGAPISIGAQPSPGPGSSPGAESSPANESRPAAPSAGEAQHDERMMEATPEQQASTDVPPSPQTAQPEQPTGQSGAAIDAASGPGSTSTQARGSISTPPPTPSPFPTTKPNATGMGNVPEPSYMNMGEIASNLYFGARAEALA